MRREELSRAQRKAIVHGLEFDRDKRTPPSAAEFLAEFRRAKVRLPRGGARFWQVLRRSFSCSVCITDSMAGLEGNADVRQVPASTVASGGVFRDCPTCPLMKVLPPGRFLQGSSADDPDAQPFEQPQHAVAIGYPFGMGVYEVTVENSGSSSTQRPPK